jgi:membrane carboxypeptidase/penicillin-binding protein
MNHIASLGLQIETTLDIQVQKDTEQVFQEKMNDYQLQRDTTFSKKKSEYQKAWEDESDPKKKQAIIDSFRYLQ